MPFSGSQSRGPLVLASIGTVLIDAFDSAPRPNPGTAGASPLPSIPPPLPCIASGPLPHIPSLPSTRPTTPSPLNPTAPPTPLSAPPTPCDSRSATPSSPDAPFPPASFTALPLLPQLTAQSSSSSLSTGIGVGGDSSTPQLSFSSPPPSPTEVHETLGGGALYALIGARIWLAPSYLSTLVDRAPRGRDGSGGDLSVQLEELLHGYGGMWVWNEGRGTRMTRARIRYEGDVRIFQHVVKAPHRPWSTLLNSPLSGAEYLHIAPPYSPEDLASLLDEMRDCTAELKAEAREWRPKIVFEPTPPSCHSGQREWLERILPGIEILSPNHEELLSFYSFPKTPLTSPFLRPTLERIITHLLDLGIGPRGEGAMVVRCGRLGSVVGTRRGGVRWFPAFFSGDKEGSVKDVTGAGNSFLGGYVAGLHLSGGDPYEAALYGTVSASFVVEQLGLPRLITSEEAGEGAGGEKAEGIGRVDLWNGDLPSRRLESLRTRVHAAS